MNRVDAFHHCVKAVKRAVLDSRKVLFALLFGERRPIASVCELYAAVFGVKLDDWFALLVPLEGVHPVLLGNGRLVGIFASRPSIGGEASVLVEGTVVEVVAVEAAVASELVVVEAAVASEVLAAVASEVVVVEVAVTGAASAA